MKIVSQSQYENIMSSWNSVVLSYGIMIIISFAIIVCFAILFLIMIIKIIKNLK